MKVTRAICIPKEMDQKLQQLAREKDRSVSYIATKLIEKAMDHIDQHPLTIDSKPVKVKRGKG